VTVKQSILKEVYNSGSEGITLKDLSDIVYPKTEALHEVVRDMIKEKKLVEIEYSVPGDFRVQSGSIPAVWK